MHALNKKVKHIMQKVISNKQDISPQRRYPLCSHGGLTLLKNCRGSSNKVAQKYLKQQFLSSCYNEALSLFLFSRNFQFVAFLCTFNVPCYYPIKFGFYPSTI